MHMIINNSSMSPIYEQIVNQVKAAILNGELVEEDALPSVRALSRELKISALTVKKAYDNLEQQGYTITVHGKGTFVAAMNKDLAVEEQRKEIEADFEQVIIKARKAGLCDEEIRTLFEIILEE